MQQRQGIDRAGQLLRIAGVIELLAGLALMVTPNAAAGVLLGAELDRVGLMVGRVAAAALLSLGIACWGASTDTGGIARTGTLRAIFFYNAVAAVLLGVFAATGQASGVVIWGAAVLHLALAVGFAPTLR